MYSSGAVRTACEIQVDERPQQGRPKITQKILTIGLQINKNFQLKLKIFSYPSIVTYVLGAQKNRLIETVLLSTHYICFV